MINRNPGNKFYQSAGLDTLKRPYSRKDLMQDLFSALTVAVVALPLALAIGVASGVTPQSVLITAVVAGFLISALGGSRTQIGGPTAAFATIVFMTVQQHGFDGLLLATFMAGLMLMLAGALRLGDAIKFVPHPVILGFTAGIGLIIVLSQLRELLGLQTGPLEAETLPKIEQLFHALPSTHSTTALVASFTLITAIILRRWRPHWPSFLLAIASAGLLTATLQLPVETLGSRFGALTFTWPHLQWPSISWERIQNVFPSAFTIALLAGIESLLSAVVADGMTGDRHNANAELFGQGIANSLSALLGGICATGAIARTATNIRSGARSPLSGMMHALILGIMVAVAAPLLSRIPLAALAAILLIVAWGMSDASHVWHQIKQRNAESLLTLTTMSLTVLVDITVAIEVGVVMAALIFMMRMSRRLEIREAEQATLETSLDQDFTINPDDIVVHHIEGALFFGATGHLEQALSRASSSPRVTILEMSKVPYMDSSGWNAISAFSRRLHEHNQSLILCQLSPQLMQDLKTHLKEAPENLETASSLFSALNKAKKYML